MEAFTRVKGVAAPLLRANVDTDQITPGRVLMKLEKKGSSAGLFANWRLRADGSQDPDFILNQPPFDHATFLIGGENFGCGSSREIAVWALSDFGIRAIIAPSFGAIFMANCLANGLLPVTLARADVVALASEIGPGATEIEVDLEGQLVRSPRGAIFGFTLGHREREMLLTGLDAIDLTLSRAEDIDAFQHWDAKRRPWVYQA